MNAEVQNFCVSFDRYICECSKYGFMHKFWISVNAEVQNFCVSFDRYMKIEKGVVDVFWIIMIVFCSTVNMDLCTQILDFCECRSTKFLCKF